MKKKQSKKTTKEKQESLIDILKGYGVQAYNDLDKGEFPKFSIPNRSISNIIYDKKLRQYILGSNTALRSAKTLHNYAHSHNYSGLHFLLIN